MYNSLYMYLCMNIIIDGKYAPCMQACAPLTGGSEQRSRPPSLHRRTLYSGGPSALCRVCATPHQVLVFPSLMNGTPAEGDAEA